MFISFSSLLLILPLLTKADNASNLRHGETKLEKESILDYTCLLTTVTGVTEDACTATEDGDDQACVWCDVSDDQGLCLTSLQAEIAEQFGMSCSDENYDESDGENEVAVESDVVDGSILDYTCLLATVTGGTKDACTATEDEDDQACVWCDASDDQGLCLTLLQSEIAEQFGISCSEKNHYEIDGEIEIKAESETVDGSILDYTCLLATVTGGTEDSCTATEDEDGQACIWCDASDDQGLCLTSLQSEIAEQFGISCSDETEVAVESEALDGSISDYTCLLATVTGGTKDACTATEDEDDQACFWCDASDDQGLCLTSLQAEIAEQFGISCSDRAHEEAGGKTKVAVRSEAVDGSILDYTCLLATVTGGTKDACTATEDDDNQACVWCDASDDQGLCLTSLQAEIAEQFGISCSAKIEGEKETSSISR